MGSRGRAMLNRIGFRPMITKHVEVRTRLGFMSSLVARCLLDSYVLGLVACLRSTKAHSLRFACELEFPNLVRPLSAALRTPLQHTGQHVRWVFDGRESMNSSMHCEPTTLAPPSRPPLPFLPPVHGRPVALVVLCGPLVILSQYPRTGLVPIFAIFKFAFDNLAPSRIMTNPEGQAGCFQATKTCGAIQCMYRVDCPRHVL